MKKRYNGVQSGSIIRNWYKKDYIFFPKTLLTNFGRPKLIVTRVIIQSKAITALTTYLMRQKTVVLAVVSGLKPSLRDWKER